MEPPAPGSGEAEVVEPPAPGSGEAEVVEPPAPGSGEAEVVDLARLGVGRGGGFGPHFCILYAYKTELLASY